MFSDVLPYLPFVVVGKGSSNYLSSLHISSSSELLDPMNTSLRGVESISPTRKLAAIFQMCSVGVVKNKNYLKQKLQK